MSIELNNLSYSYPAPGGGEIEALCGVSLKLHPGETVAVMGRTGCGKSTLLQLIAGLLVPKSGSVSIGGQDINSRRYDRAEIRRTVGMVFQYPEYQLFETTVERDVAFGLKHSGLDRGEVAERVREALTAVGFDFEDIRYQPPLALSGGEKRRVAIAGVLASRPRILLFDEPIAGLDPGGRRDFLRLVAELRLGGATVIIVTHNIDAAAEFANRIIVMSEGKVALDGSAPHVVRELYAHPELGVLPGSASLIASRLAGRGFIPASDIVTEAELISCLKRRLSGGVKI